MDLRPVGRSQQQRDLLRDGFDVDGHGGHAVVARVPEERVPRPPNQGRLREEAHDGGDRDHARGGRGHETPGMEHSERSHSFIGG